MSEKRICIECGDEKDLETEFYFRIENNAYRTKCKVCWRNQRKEYIKTNLTKKDISAAHKRWRENNVEKSRIDSREKMRRYREDPAYRLRKNMSRSTHRALVADGYSKGGICFLESAGYSHFELNNHIESYWILPENKWMSWDNYGKYNSKTWDDNDETTWTWELDHIIPHSEFHYEEPGDEEFKKCWGLSNIRPYSAKQNVIDGASRSRHISPKTALKSKK